MSNKNLTIDLKARKDKHNQVFYVGKIKGPIMIDCSEGVVFLIYTSEENLEELQIASMDNKEMED